VPVSKQLCVKPVAPQLWRVEDVADHWDKLELRSWITEGGKRVPLPAGRGGGDARALSICSTTTIQK